MTIERTGPGHRIGGVLAVALAAIAVAAGFYGGATDPLGRVALAALCALLALAFASVPRVADSASSRRVAWALGALGALAFAQTIALPAGVAKAVAPLAYASHDAYGGLDGGVRTSLDADATGRTGVLLLGFAVLVGAIGARIRGGAAPALARALALGALAHAAVALAIGHYPYTPQPTVIFGGFEVANPFQAYGSFANRAQFAAFGTVGLGAALWLVAAPARSLLDRALGLVATAVVAAGVVASGSRTGLVGVALALASAFVLGAAPGRRRRRMIGVLVAGALVVGGRVVGLDPLVRAMPWRGDEARRLDIWRGSCALALRQPVAGVGLDAFRYAYAGEGREPTDRAVGVAENDLLQLAAEGGCLGLAIAAYGAAVLVGGLRSRARAASPGARRAAGLALAGPLGLLPLSATGVPLHAPAVVIAAIASGALVLSLLREEADPDDSG